jgi:aspartate kinase
VGAVIQDVKPQRVFEALHKGKVVILAGFQGVSAQTKEITTLGRGGTDLTAVAIAASLKASHCEILKDVPSIFTADPSLVKTAKAIAKLSYEELMEMTFWGAKVLHYRSAELAAIKRVKIYIGPSKTIVSSTGKNEPQGTWIKEFNNKEFEMTFQNSSQQFEADKIITINSHQEVLKLNIEAASQFEALTKIKNELHSKEIIFPQILNVESTGNDFSFIITAPSEVINQIKKAQFTFNLGSESLCCIALTCTGLPSFETQEKIYKKLSEIKINVQKTFISSISLALVISMAKQEEAIKALHQLIDN